MIQHTQSAAPLSNQVEHYRSARDRATGLLKFENKPDGLAAVFHLPLFGFFPAVHTFGMKFSIDLVFCDSEKKVLSIFQDVAPGRWVLPWRYFFGGCSFLIEFVGCDLSRVNVGDQLKW